jgi:hypothetical protein
MLKSLQSGLVAGGGSKMLKDIKKQKSSYNDQHQRQELN